MRARILFLTLIFATSGFIASAQTLGTFNFTNGGEPVAALTLGADGNFYGTTQQGGGICAIDHLFAAQKDTHCFYVDEFDDEMPPGKIAGNL